MHVFEAENDFGGVEFHVLLAEDSVSGEVIVKIAAVHEIKYEAELVGSLECVRHAHDEGAIVLRCERVFAGSKHAHALTPVLTSESMMRSLSAKVSPCLSLMRFLSRHFIAYLHHIVLD